MEEDVTLVADEIVAKNSSAAEHFNSNGLGMSAFSTPYHENSFEHSAVDWFIKNL